MECFNKYCDNELDDYRVEKHEKNPRTKFRFCGRCVTHYRNQLVWKCINCDNFIESRDYRKIYCGTECRLNAKYIRTKPKIKQYQRNHKKPKNCTVCKRDVTQDDRSYPFKICYDCRTAFITKYNNLKCLLCQKRLNSGKLYCSKKCRVLSAIEMERRRNEVL